MILLRGTVVTDIHFGMDLVKRTGTKLGSWGPTLTEAFVKIANHTNPDFVANLGDNYIANMDILNSSAYEDHHDTLSTIFSRLNVPYGENQGNHDQTLALYHTANKGACPRFPLLPRPLPMEFDRARVVFWNAESYVWQAKKISAGNKQKDWLKRTLEASGKPTVVFAHAPFEYYQDEAELRYILRDYGNVALAMHGHKHKPDRLEVTENIPYFTQQSLTEKQPGCALPWGAYAQLTMEENEITIERKNIMAPCSEDKTFRIRKTETGLETKTETAPCPA